MRFSRTSARDLDVFHWKRSQNALEVSWELLESALGIGTDRPVSREGHRVDQIITAGLFAHPHHITLVQKCFRDALDEQYLTPAVLLHSEPRHVGGLE